MHKHRTNAGMQAQPKWLSQLILFSQTEGFKSSRPLMIYEG